MEANRWKFYRGKGWKKWVSADRQAWVTQLLRKPHMVHYGHNGAYAGAIQCSPSEVMTRLDELLALECRVA